ncbi:MAG: hypothetical protein ACRECC_08425 [Pseudolabrys sp.]
MWRVAVRSLIFLALLVGTAVAQTEQSLSHPSSDTSTEKGKGQNFGAQDFPFILRIISGQQKQETVATGSGEQSKKMPDNWNLSDKIAAIASIAALLQFIALIATFWIMVRNGRRQLRAYVFPHDAGLYDGSMMSPPNQAHLNEPGVVLQFRNSGQTPAYAVVSWAKIEVTAPGNEDSLKVPLLEDKFRNFIAVNGVMPKALWYGRPLTTQEITSVVNGSLFIYLYGRIEYRDAFKKKRFTEFRYSYAGPFPPPPNVIFQVCEKGNDSS